MLYLFECAMEGELKYDMQRVHDLFHLGFVYKEKSRGETLCFKSEDKMQMKKVIIEAFKLTQVYLTNEAEKKKPSVLYCKQTLVILTNFAPPHAGWDYSSGKEKELFSVCVFGLSVQPKCSKCGALAERSDKFCSQCSAEVVQSKPDIDLKELYEVALKGG